MKPYVILLAAILLSIPASNTQGKEYTRLLQSVRNLQQQRDGGTICTVSLINKAKGYWLTAAHCVDGDGQLFINNEPAFITNVTAIEGGGGDMAILMSPTATAPRALKLAKHGPKFGDMVRVAGYPVGTGPLITPGQVTNPYLFVLHYREWLTVFSMEVCGGNSGSAVVNSRDEVISVLTRYYYPPPYPCSGMSAGTPYQTLRAFAGKYFER